MVLHRHSSLLRFTKYIFPVDANEYFEMTFTEGNLELIIENGLPTDLSNVVINLRNVGQSNNIITMNIPTLVSGESATTIIS